MNRTEHRITQAAVNDFNAGKKERMAGYYDKWYRYNRYDDGNAYDQGCLEAVNSGKAPDNCIIIEYNQI